MTSPIRRLDTGLKSGRWNVAMTTALTERHADGRTPDTIRLHRYQPCALLGRSQDPSRTVDVAFCRLHGVEIVRRATGGGAVYMNPGMLAWEIIFDRRTAGGDLARATRLICEGVAVGLTRLGVDARFRAPNDIEVGGRKISGSSGYAYGRSAVLQGTLLIADAVRPMAGILGVPESTLRERITCLTAVLTPPPPLAEIGESVVCGIGGAIGRLPVAGVPLGEEFASAELLLHSDVEAEHCVRGARGGEER
jgi:lipoate---protein ligase